MTVADLAALLAGQPARRLWLPWEFPSFNDLEAARSKTTYIDGRLVSAYQPLKARHQYRAMVFARRELPRGPMLHPCVPVFRFVESSGRRDPDGFMAGAAKLILDALGPGRKPDKLGRGGWPGAGVLHCDGQHCMAAPPAGVYDVDRKAPGVEVLLFEVRP